MKQRLADIRARIARSCDDVKRDPASITLVAVTKYATNDAVKQALDLGLTHFGENRVQDAGERWAGLKTPGITLHLIGPLQTNKVKQAVSFFDVLHTLDRPSLDAELAKEDWAKPTFVQVNTGEEDQKSGLLPRDLDAFLKDAQTPVQGLMCIPPVDAPASLHFALLANLAKRSGLAMLSMGMTNDFENAIRCGATHISGWAAHCLGIRLTL